MTRVALVGARVFDGAAIAAAHRRFGVIVLLDDALQVSETWIDSKSSADAG